MTVIAQDDHLTVGAWAACASMSFGCAKECYYSSEKQSITRLRKYRQQVGRRWTYEKCLMMYTIPQVLGI